MLTRWQLDRGFLVVRSLIKLLSQLVLTLLFNKLAKLGIALLALSEFDFKPF